MNESTGKLKDHDKIKVLDWNENIQELWLQGRDMWECEPLRYFE